MVDLFKGYILYPQLVLNIGGGSLFKPKSSQKINQDTEKRRRLVLSNLNLKRQILNLDQYLYLKHCKRNTKTMRLYESGKLIVLQIIEKLHWTPKPFPKGCSHSQIRRFCSSKIII